MRVHIYCKSILFYLSCPSKSNIGLSLPGSIVEANWPKEVNGPEEFGLAIPSARDQSIIIIGWNSRVRKVEILHRSLVNKYIQYCLVKFNMYTSSISPVVLELFCLILNRSIWFTGTKFMIKCKKKFRFW